MDNFDMEVWKLVADFPDYAVSNHGRIRSLRMRKGAKVRVLKNFVRRARPPKPSAIATAFRQDGKTHTLRVHRLVLEAFVGPCPNGMEGCHNDGNVFNNKLDNLRWDTHRANAQDAKRHGTASNPPIHNGESHPHSKLTDDAVRDIRSTVYRYGTVKELSAKYGVRPITITRVRDGEAWKTLT